MKIGLRVRESVTRGEGIIPHGARLETVPLTE